MKKIGLGIVFLTAFSLQTKAQDLKSIFGTIKSEVEKNQSTKENKKNEEKK